MGLNTVPIGSRVRVTGVRLAGARSQRLMEMGLIEGAELQLIRRAPFGDPLQLRLGDYELSLRSSEAELIDVVAA